MKNKNDHPWHGYKKRLAKQTNEITQVLNIGPEKRNLMLTEGRLKGLQDIRKKHLETFKIASKDAVNNILRANREGCFLGLNRIAKDLPEQAPVEFYFDFETVSDLNETVGQELFDTSPGIGGQTNIIYMIGCYVRDTRTGEHEYLNYLVDDIDPQNEKKILTDWINDLHEIMAKHYPNYNQPGENAPRSVTGITSPATRTTGTKRTTRSMRSRLRKRERDEDSESSDSSDSRDNSDGSRSNVMDKNVARPKIRLFHWSPAEIVQLRRAKTAYGTLINAFMDEAEFIDLYALFKKNEVGIPGAFGYGLKSVAKALHRLGKIESTWEENMNGADAMVAAWYLKYRTDHEPHTFLDSQQGSGTLLHPEQMIEQEEKRPQKQGDSLAKEIIIYNYYDCKVMDEIAEFVRKEK